MLQVASVTKSIDKEHNTCIILSKEY